MGIRGTSTRYGTGHLTGLLRIVNLNERVGRKIKPWQNKIMYLFINDVYNKFMDFQMY